MSALVVSPLTVADAARILRDATKDKSYRATPLGLEVARYYRWFKNEWGATTESLRDYEAILAKTSLHFADLELKDFEPPVGTERLRECWDHYWGDRKPATRKKVRSVWVAFFDWACRERGLHGNPARPLASPKVRDSKRDTFEESFVHLVIGRQEHLCDKLGADLVLEYALRRAELAGVRFRDFDFERRYLTVTGKGGKVRVVPIVAAWFWRDLAAAQLELQAREDHFLLHHVRKVGLHEFRYPHKGFVPRSIHTWWYACLERAGIVTGGRDGGEWHGLNMHRGRHTVATDILRKTGNIVAAKDMLGHADIATTVRAYAHFDTADLERVLSKMRPEDG